MDQNEQVPDSEGIIEPKVEFDLCKICFICLNDTSHARDRERDKEKCSSSSGVTVRILTSYILQNLGNLPYSSSDLDPVKSGEREELQRSILSNFVNGRASICSECLSKGESLVALHLGLEKIQMQISEVLGSLQDYLKLSMVGVEGIEEDVILYRFQVLVKQFTCRELWNGMKVRLKRLPTTSSDFTTSANYVPPEGVNPSNEDDGEQNVDEDFNHDVDMDETYEGEEEEDITAATAVVKNVAGHIKPDPVLRCRTTYWECDICLESIPFKEMEEHLRTHPQFEKIYKCEICPASSLPSKRIYGSYKGLIWHYLQRRHKVQMPCTLCPDPSILFLRTHLCKHLYEVHKLKHKKLPCKHPKCSKEFYEDSSRRSHYRRKHSDEPQPIKGNNSDNRRWRFKQNEGQRRLINHWDCDICLEAIPFKKMKNHLKTHTEFEKYYKCELCPSSERVFGSYKGLVWHYLRKCHKVQMPCVLCPDQSILFLRTKLCKHLYEFHQINHKKLTCRQPGCPQEFYDHGSQQQHFCTKHSDNPPSVKAECPVCSKLVRKYSLPYHIKRMHGGGKDKSSPEQEQKQDGGKQLSFSCHICQKKSTSKGGISKHVRKYHPQDKAMLASKKASRKNKTKLQLQSCQYCSQKFRSELRLRRHEKTHQTPEPDEESWSCTPCQMQFQSKMAFRIHQEVHHEDEAPPTLCPHCCKEFRNRYKLWAHIKLTHNAPVPEPESDVQGEDEIVATSASGSEPSSSSSMRLLQCQYCPRTFKWRTSLYRHEKIHRNTRSYKCPDCQYAANTYAILKGHRKIHAKGKTISVACLYCAQTFNSRAALRFHEKAHEESSEMFVCPHCQKQFKHKKLLSTHVQVVHEGKKRRSKVPLQCQFCPKTFRLNVCLRLHEASHMNLRSYKCPKCPYASNNPSNLCAHMKVHQEGAFKCTYCPKTFRSKYNWKNHERAHTQEKPYKCRVEGCELAFTSSSVRRDHEKRKHGCPRQNLSVAGDGEGENQPKEEKRYMCDSCPKIYKEHRDLRRHKEGVHGNPEMVACPQCEKMFRKHRLQYHVRKVHGQKPLECRYCGESFTRRDWLQMHEETHLEEQAK